MAIEPLSPELRGGGGFSFEDAVAAVYLTALLTETVAPGIKTGIVTRVALQGAASGEPMDDVIVHSTLLDQSQVKLALQVKRQLTVSAAATNTDFRAVVLDAVETIRGGDFRQGVDQVGVATGTVSAVTKRATIFVCEFARGSDSFEHFRSRLFEPGFADEQKRGVFTNVSTILSDAGQDEPDRTAYAFLRHFVLIELDLLHQGSTSDATAINTLASVLQPDAAAYAPELWNRLRGIVREGAAVATVYSRTSLIQRLGGAFRLVGAPSFRRTLRLLEEEARKAASEIPNLIAGRTYAREAPLREASGSSAVVTHLVGLPGSGKSAVLRMLVEESLSRGPVLFLKSDRLSGRNWRSYAAAMDLDNVDLTALLVELASTGDGIVFIDGIDRVEVANRNVISDVVTAVLEDLGRSTLRIVVTVRGNEFDALQTWLPEQLLTGNGTRIVEVQPFNDAECRVILEDLPALRPLLFGGDRVQEISRRPFFTSALAKAAVLVSRPSPSVLTEVDLAAAWWAGAGLDAERGPRGRRQGVILELARLGARTLGRRMSVADLDPDVVAELVADGVVRETRSGHSLTFSHDIFFEWAFLQLLIRRERGWLTAVSDAGEPPALGRAVELLSQWTLEQREGWSEQYAQLDSAGMRSQWRRAWLIGAFESPSFAEHSSTMTSVLFRGDAKLFERLVLWFQAERTRPNPFVLSGNGYIAELPSRQRVRYADALAWPSDFRSWGRFLDYLLETRPLQSARMMPAVVEAFGVWQNLFRAPDLNMRLSRRLCAIVDEWLAAIESWRYADAFRPTPGEWSDLPRGAVKALETRLRSLLLTAGPHEATRISAYLERVSRNGRLAHDTFEEIATVARLLIEQGHAHLLRQATLAACVEDLPEVVHARRAAERPPRLISSDFSHHDWQSLSVDRLMSLSPAAPAREPFRSLFQHAPDEGRALVRDLANHAITAWRQLHRLSYDRRGTPIPAKIEWPWGSAEYWGDDQTYCWPRGVWGPGPVSTGLMALEAWALQQVRDGRALDAVIRDVVEGHDGNAVLSTAVMLSLTDARGTPAAGALVSSQRIWRWDERRFRDDFSRSAKLIGFQYRGDQELGESVQQLNDLPARKLMMASLAMSVVLRDSEAATTARAAIERFPSDLPFDLEEERTNPEAVAYLHEQALPRVAFASRENYDFQRTAAGDGVQIIFNDPRAGDPVKQQQAQEASRWLSATSMAIWASNVLDRAAPIFRGEYEPHLSAIASSMPPDLGGGNPAEQAERFSQTATAVAAACLAFGTDLTVDEISWCKARILEAGSVPPDQGDWEQPYIIPVFNPANFAAHGLAGLARLGRIDEDELLVLVRICAHPLDAVAQKAIAALVSLHSSHPRLAWAGLLICLKRAVVPVRPFDPDHPTGDPNADRRRMDEVLSAVLDWYHNAEASFDCYALPAALEPIVDDGRPWRNGVRRPRDAYLHHKFLGEVLKSLRWETMAVDPVIGAPTLQLLERLTAWTVSSVGPFEGQQARRSSDDRRVTELMLWGHNLFGCLARVALVIPPSETQRRFLNSALALPDEPCLMLLKYFVFSISARGIMDPDEASPTAIVHLLACAERVSRADELAKRDYGRDSPWNRDLGPIIQDLFFVSIDDASRAARFANGDFSGLEVILPIVEKVASAATRSRVGLEAYLTLCERSQPLFPTEPFIRLVTDILGNAAMAPIEWIGTSIPGRIAALIHDLAERDSPLDAGLSRSMLVILDALVDIGDRRSAALQASQIFSEVRVA